MKPNGSRLRISGLYVIIDPQQTRGRDPVEVARQALRGGARILQWRDKTRDKGEQLPQARAIRELCREYDALFIVNDHVDLALACAADGVHLGQKDLPVETVRPWAPAGFLIGVSTNNAEEARQAEKDGAGYVAVGSIFPTGSKEVTRPASLERLREVKQAVKHTGSGHRRHQRGEHRSGAGGGSRRRGRHQRRLRRGGRGGGRPPSCRQVRSGVGNVSATGNERG